MGSSEAVWAWRKREQNFRMLANHNLLASWIPDSATTGFCNYWMRGVRLNCGELALQSLLFRHRRTRANTRSRMPRAISPEKSPGLPLLLYMPVLAFCGWSTDNPFP